MKNSKPAWQRSATDRSDPARRARAARRHQPRRPVGRDRASFRRAVQPLLEAALRVGAGPRADHARGRCAAAGVGARHHQPGRAAEPGHRRPAVRPNTSRAGRFSRSKIERFRPADRRVRRRDAVSRASRKCSGDAAGRAAIEPGFQQRHRPRRADLRAAESERPQRATSATRRCCAAFKRARAGAHRAVRSVRRHRAAAARPLHQQNQRQQQQENHPEQPEQRRRTTPSTPAAAPSRTAPRKRAGSRSTGSAPRAMNPPARRLERALRRRRVGVDVRAEDVDVGLRACAPAACRSPRCRCCRRDCASG